LPTKNARVRIGEFQWTVDANYKEQLQKELDEILLLCNITGLCIAIDRNKYYTGQKIISISIKNSRGMFCANISLTSILQQKEHTVFGCWVWNRNNEKTMYELFCEEGHKRKIKKGYSGGVEVRKSYDLVLQALNHVKLWVLNEGQYIA
jgi:hypothetical protein